MSRIVSFRGLLADGAQEEIALQTNNGLTGYRIVKFEIFPNAPGTESSESTLQIFKTEQTTPSTSTALVDFSDNRLLAAAFYGKAAGVDNAETLITIFDKEIFNQDIFITHTETAAAQPCNYYIELEQMPLAIDQATVATLKDIRNND